MQPDDSRRRGVDLFQVLDRINGCNVPFLRIEMLKRVHPSDALRMTKGSPIIPHQRSNFKHQTSNRFPNLKLKTKGLPPRVHFLIVVQVIAAGNFLHPLAVGQVPVNGSFYTFFKLERRFPAQFFHYFVGINSIA